MSESSVAPDMVPVCRSIMIEGRRTSIRMEREFWTGLDHIRKQRGLSMQEVLRQATAGGEDINRTASIKTWVLAYFRQSGLLH